ncbi:unnamed protein product (macronuclear) [Paramecium tetraurelia]|uniref:Uncharacterized protein n=1 Tax=Paramecium tetraurelia TaxID=5888 RepID=A0C1B5_PARTE|nr:uncharacterized protein GSPATT00034058001 [Paramecium tetraurelia]CAK64582.1 unnamed protein product [Paramecium tetraurelia]|eukprot:XP_001431980.1 hypothetical protein (macronuclear) [Paramecium tetraurelia strain d4-2]
MLLLTLALRIIKLNISMKNYQYMLSLIRITSQLNSIQKFLSLIKLSRLQNGTMVLSITKLESKIVVAFEQKKNDKFQILNLVGPKQAAIILIFILDRLRHGGLFQFT